MKRKAFLWFILPPFLLVLLGIYWRGLFPYNGLWYHKGETGTWDFVLTFWYGSSDLTTITHAKERVYDCSYVMEGKRALLSCSLAEEGRNETIRYLVGLPPDSEYPAQFLTLTPVIKTHADGSRTLGTPIKLIKRGRM